jgi:hypothetical protein
VSSDPTINVLDDTGSQVYEAAVVGMELNESLARLLLDSSLLTLGIDRKELSIDELGSMLPEIDSRLRRFIEPTQVDDVMRRLHHLIFRWDETVS